MEDCKPSPLSGFGGSGAFERGVTAWSIARSFPLYDSRTIVLSSVASSSETKEEEEAGEGGEFGGGVEGMSFPSNPSCTKRERSGRDLDGPGYISLRDKYEREALSTLSFLQNVGFGRLPNAVRSPSFLLTNVPHALHDSLASRYASKEMAKLFSAGVRLFHAIRRKRRN